MAERRSPTLGASELKMHCSVAWDEIVGTGSRWLGKTEAASSNHRQAGGRELGVHESHSGNPI